MRQSSSLNTEIPVRETTPFYAWNCSEGGACGGSVRLGRDGLARYMVSDPTYRRPAEVDLLFGDPSRAKAELRWEPYVKFKELVKLMVEADLKCTECEARNT